MLLNFCAHALITMGSIVRNVNVAQNNFKVLYLCNMHYAIFVYSKSLAFAIFYPGIAHLTGG